MKKTLNNIMLLLLCGTSVFTVSCKEDDNNSSSTNTNREFMTMFIRDENRAKGSDYQYNCGLDGNYPNGNTIHLYWYGVNDCAGYQVQMALQPKVSGGPEAWAKVQGTSDLLLDTIVGPKVLDLLIKDLQYSTDYRFAIRALSTLDRNIKGDETTFAHASNWYGHGSGRQWSEYMGISTDPRYPTPNVIYVNQAETTEETMHVYLHKTINEVGLDLNTEEDQEKLAAYYEHFNIDSNGKFGYKYLTVTPSPNNPNASVDEKWKKYEIQEEDYTRGYIVITGLSKNSTYVIDVIDPLISVPVDAKYNTVTQRSDGTPGEPILLSHEQLMAEAASLAIPNRDESRADVFALASEYDAAPISPTLYDFISNADYAEGQTFLLEGGKTYYLDGNDITCKGFVLRTNPDDVAKGLRAKVICGLGKSSAIYEQGTNGEQWQGPYTCFMFGRQPEAGEGGEIYMKKLAFYDIDFDNPKALNYGDTQAGLGTAAGNYFFNMYSNGMAVTLDSLVIENCSFKRMVRGFIREQGKNYKIWNHVLIKNNLIYDCGYYNAAAGGYCFIDGSAQNAASNLYRDMKIVENTFYDSPYPTLIKEQTALNWEAGAWNITIQNNTFINFNTRANGALIKMVGMPDGSVYNVKNNLFVLCKQPADQRVLQMWGSQIEDTQNLGGDKGRAHVTLNFDNNWSTNNDLSGTNPPCIFSANRWTSEENGFQLLVTANHATLNGTLDVKVANISATDLMIQPCPPHVANTSADQNMHRADALDGTAKEYNVNLFFKDKNNDIYNNNVGASRWRNQ